MWERVEVWQTQAKGYMVTRNTQNGRYLPSCWNRYTRNNRPGQMLFGPECDTLAQAVAWLKGR